MDSPVGPDDTRFQKPAAAPVRTAEWFAPACSATHVEEQRRIRLI